VKVAAFGALLKFLYVGAAGAGMDALPVALPTVLAWVAILTMTVGNLLALPQRNVKRVLAYSAVAHAGYLLLGCVAMSADPTLPGYDLPGGAVPFYLVGYALASLAAFAALSTVGSKGQELTRESELAGLGWRYPFAGAVLTLAMFSLAGVPPTLGFFGKLSLIQEVLSVEDGRWLPFIVIMIVNSIVSAYYYLRVTVYVYMRPATDEQPEPLRSTGLSWAMAIAALAILAIGVLPGRAMDAAAKASAGVRTDTVAAHVRYELGPAPVKEAAAADSDEVAKVER
jgi:NADH-quinone oxidoreductase subunit N